MPRLSAVVRKIPRGLTPAQHTFALEYLANGFNATRAYRTAHRAATPNTAKVEGHRTLAHPRVRAFLDRHLEAAWKVAQMEGDEALARVARVARMDIRDLFDERGRLLNPRDWPESTAGCVKALHKGPHGWSVTLVEPLQALRIILEQTGKLNAPGESVDALAAAIRADLARHGQPDQ